MNSKIRHPMGLRHPLLKVYLSRKEFSFVMYVGLFSCILVSFHVCCSLITCRHTSSLSITKEILFSCTLLFFHISYIGLFSCMSVSFHVYCPVLTHIKSVSIAKGGLFLYFIYRSLSMYIGLFSSVYWFLFMYTGLFDQTSKVSVSRKEVSFHL